MLIVGGGGRGRNRKSRTVDTKAQRRRVKTERRVWRRVWNSRADDFLIDRNLLWVVETSVHFVVSDVSSMVLRS